MPEVVTLQWMVWSREMARDLILDGYHWFYVDASKWRDEFVPQPKARIVKREPVAVGADVAYDIYAETVEDALDAISYVATLWRGVDGVIVVEVRVTIPTLPYDGVRGAIIGREEF